MSNYLSQIAARNASPDQPLLMPAHSRVQSGLDDPFDQVSFAADETGHAAISGPVQPVKEQAADAAASAQTVEIKPVYLSKYIERNNYYTREHTHEVFTKSQSRNEVVRVEVEHPVSPILPAAENRPATNEAAQQIPPIEKINPVQQKDKVDMELTPKQKNRVLEKTANIEEQSSLLLPVAATTAHNKKPVLLQPHPILQPHADPQKEKSVPALVIGKITVEIVPAQKPVNKIINRVIKPQPAASASVYRSKNSFGLGQL